jgi:hypothetical protein
MNEATNADAVQEHPGPPPPTDLPEVLPLAMNGATPAVDVWVRTSSLGIKLALLERGHAAAARSRLRRRLWMILAFILAVGVGAAVGAISGAGMYQLFYESPPPPPPPPRRTDARVADEKGKMHYFIDGQEVDYVQYQVYQQNAPRSQPQTQTYPDNSRATAAGLLWGVSIALLFPLLIWLFLIRRIGQGGPDGLDLEEQIAAIVRAHPDVVESWGGPIVLRNWDLVRELLALERDAQRPSRPGAR